MKRNHLFSIITAGMLTITLLAGCGNTGSNANADPGSNTNTVQESTEDQASAVPESEAQITGEGQNGETIIVTDVRGEVEIPADPQRIVDLSGNSDILSILGYSVVGTANSDAYDYTKFPTYLEDTLQGAEILGYSMQDTMDIEAVMNLDPDLIIISTVQEKMYDQLSEIAPTVMIQLEALNISARLHRYLAERMRQISGSAHMKRRRKKPEKQSVLHMERIPVICHF